MNVEKLKKILGDKYVEGMSETDAVEALMSVNEEKTAQYDKAKTSFDKTAHELASLKQANKEKMTDEEQRNAEIEQIKAENEAYKKQITISDNTSKFLKLGYDEKLAKETAEAFVNGDTATVFANQEKFLKAKEESLKADLLKQTPRPGASGTDDDSTVTKEKFSKMGLGERTELYQNNPELYKQLTTENGGK